jgi:pantetheine-phosphate adenylyltransferase
VSFLVRGLRAYSDFEYEFRMALINRQLTGIETSFIMADAAYVHLSSSLIRQLAHFKKTLPDFVPESISEDVFKRLGVPYEKK